MDDRKTIRAHRWNIIRSEIRHQGFGWWLYKKVMRRFQ